MAFASAWNIAKGTVSEFMEDGVPRLAAALAYYAMFSIAPLLVIVIAVAGLFFDQQDVQKQVNQQVENFMGSQAAGTVQSMMTQKHESSVVATILGTIALLFGASGVFGQLQDALNTIWEVKPKEGQGVWGFIRSRFLSFAMVLGIAFLLLISMVITTGLELFSGVISQALPMPEVAAKGLHLGVSFAVITLLFAMIFKVLPDAEVRWRDVWVGAIGTALLFTLGKYLIAMYLGRQSTASAYGAAGSFIVLLLWVYYSSIILFFGAEFTQVYARKLGSRIVPSPNAERVREEDRAEEGIPHSSGGQPGFHVEPQYAHNLHSQSGNGHGWGAAGAHAREPFSVVASAVGFGFIGGWLAHRRWKRPRRST
jgi:membrane protein